MSSYKAVVAEGNRVSLPISDAKDIESIVKAIKEVATPTLQERVAGIPKKQNVDVAPELVGVELVSSKVGADAHVKPQPYHAGVPSKNYNAI